MSPVELLAQPWCRPLALVLLHFVWQGTLIALVLAVAVELLGIRKLADRHACSLLALVAMALCPVATGGYLWLSQPAPTAIETPNVLESPAVAVTSDWGQLLSAAQPYLLGIWLVGVSFFAARLLLGVAGLRRLRRNLLPLPAELAERVAILGRRLRIEARPLVHLSRNVSEAIAVGLIRPLVLIPAAWAIEMPPALLEAVIAHELAHLRRGDLWINLVQRVVETLLFYHPAVWWLSRRLRTERELCCDALAVAVTGERLQYAQALENVARRQGARVQPLLAAGIRGEKNMRLLQRVRSVLGMSATADRSRLWPAGLAALALPLAVWAVASVFGSAGVADEERKEGDKPAAEAKEGAKFFGKEGDVPRREEARDGDAPRREGAREDAPRREGAREDAPRREGAREGDAPRREGAREGDAPRREGEGDRRPVARDGDAPKREGVRDGDVRKPGVREEGRGERALTPAEMEGLIRKLTAQVQQLQAELAAARGGKYPVKEGAREGDRKPDVKKEEPRREGGDKPAIKKDEPRREGGDKPAIKKDEPRREGGDKPGIKKEEPRREGGDKPAIKKEEPRREGEVKKDEPRKEGEVKKDEPRKEGEVKKDEPRKEGEVKKDEPRKEGEVKKDGDRKPE